MIAITSGINFADIDSVASSFALHELLKLQSKESHIILPLNFSNITSEMYNWFDKSIVINFQNYQYSEEEIYIVDVSEQAFISQLIDRKKITLLYDHHFGFESQWKGYDIKDLRIEHIGATATQVFELFVRSNLVDNISSNTANLLYVTIITHTLNLKSQVTTQRDIDAVNTLEKYISIDRSWITKYYTQLECEILKNLKEAIINDTKFSPIQGTEIAFGQLELWNGSTFIKDNLEEIKNAMKSANRTEWLFSIPSISNGKNYVLCNSDWIRNLLTTKLGFKFSNEFGVSENLYLRKEILKVIQ